MASTYSTLKIELIGTGEQSGTWGTTTNTNLGTAIEEAIVGSADVSFSSADVTLTLTDTNAAQIARNLRLNLTGTSGGARNLILGSGCQIEKPYLINNGLSDTVTVKNTTGTGIAVPAGKSMWVYNNGTNVVDAVTHLTSLTLGSALPIASGGTGTTSTTFVNLTTNVTGTLPVANGGTGATTEATARTNLGATTIGSNLFTLTNPGAIRFPRFNADNTVSSLSDSDFRTAIGAGTGNGTVTSVGGTGTVNGITLSGTVSSSGNLTLGGTLSNVSLTTQVTGTLPVANGGTGITSFGTGVATWLGTPSSANLAAAVTDETGSGSLVFATSPTLVTPTLGVATATSINKVAFTAPATSATLTIANGKTLTANNSLTLAGTDATTMTFPSTSQTIAGLGLTQTFTAAQTFRAASAIRSEAASTQDAIVIAGRAGGSNSYAITLTPATLAASRTLTLPEPGSNETLGYINTPIISQSAAYTLVLTDAGKTILHPDTDNNARTFTIPANGSVAYPVGTVITFVNMKNTLTIAITTDTMYLAGPGTTGSRTLAEYGVATAVKLTSTTWLISGNGIS
jgi:hypothetical protein